MVDRGFAELLEPQMFGLSRKFHVERRYSDVLQKYNLEQSAHGLQPPAPSPGFQNFRPTLLVLTKLFGLCLYKASI